MADSMTPLAEKMRKGYIVPINLPSVPSPKGRGDREGSLPSRDTRRGSSIKGGEI
jgi:hypothetical protein